MVLDGMVPLIITDAYYDLAIRTPDPTLAKRYLALAKQSYVVGHQRSVLALVPQRNSNAHPAVASSTSESPAGGVVPYALVL